MKKLGYQAVCRYEYPTPDTIGYGWFEVYKNGKEISSEEARELQSKLVDSGIEEPHEIDA